MIIIIIIMRFPTTPIYIISILTLLFSPSCAWMKLSASRPPHTGAPPATVEAATTDSLVISPQIDRPVETERPLLPLPLPVEAPTAEASGIPEAPPGPVPPERSEAAVRQVMKTYSRTIVPCSFVLRDHPDLSGVVVLRVRVAPDGRVAGTSVIENTTDDDDLGRCLADASGTWRFLPVDEEVSRYVIVRLPFRMN